MFLSNRIYFFTGLVLLGIVACLLVGVPLSGAASSYQAQDRGDTAKFLADVNDHTAVYIVSTAAFTLLDSVFGVLVGALLYLVFRDRSRALAIALFAGFVAQSAVSLSGDVIDAAFVPLAKDFANGGAGVSAGDASTLELAHTLGWVVEFLHDASGTMLAVAFLALGWLLVASPAGKVNPPKALGWLAIVGGVLSVTAWSAEAADALGLLNLLGLIVILVFTGWLGVWFLIRGKSLPDPIAAG